MNHSPHEPDLPHIPERNLGAVVALEKAVVGAVWQNCGFSCEYPQGSVMPVAKMIDGDIETTVRNALKGFHSKYEVREEIWEWMIGMMISSLESNADYWEFLSRSSIGAWESAQWMRAKLSKVKLAWLMGENDDGHRQEAATHAVAKLVFALTAQVLDEGDEEVVAFS